MVNCIVVLCDDPKWPTKLEAMLDRPRLLNVALAPPDVVRESIPMTTSPPGKVVVHGIVKSLMPE